MGSLSEGGARLELEPLLAIAFARIERNRVAELERPDRRAPGDADTRRIAERLELRLLAVLVDLAGVHEDASAHRLVALDDRIERLEVADDLAPAAERVAELILRPERRCVVAAHRIDAAREERLEERQRASRQAAAVAQI